MTYNPDIHHRRSIRLQEYDYSDAGAYFVTICAFQRECLFGCIMDGEMRLNEFGMAVSECWSGVQDYFPNLELDEFVIMPNHHHGILLINNVTVGSILGANVEANAGTNVGAKQVSSASPAFGADAEKQGEAGESFASPLQKPLPHGTQSGSLGAVLQNFKSVSTRRINKLRNNPGCPVWQRNYYERVIRNENELSKAREYIVNNPMKWELDKENPINTAG